MGLDPASNSCHLIQQCLCVWGAVPPALGGAGRSRGALGGSPGLLLPVPGCDASERARRALNKNKLLAPLSLGVFSSQIFVQGAGQGEADRDCE